MNTKLILSAGLLALGASGLGAQGVNITVGNNEGFVDGAVPVRLSVDESAGIVGASFFVTYDTQALEVEVTSDFFPPLVVQLEEAGAFANGPASLDLDIVEEGSSIQTSIVADSGMAITATRILPSDGSNTTLFTLWFTRKEPRTAGSYPVSIEPLTVTNVNGGFPAEGEEVPLLIGFDGDAYSLLLEPADVPANIDPGAVDFLELLVDSDNDGMPDSWEEGFFEGDLDVATEISDFDRDGFPDVVEYLLGLHPKEVDMPGILSLESDGTDYAFTFPLRNVHSLQYQIEWSTNGLEWITENVFFAERPDLGTGPDWTTVEATFVVGENPDEAVLARLILLGD